MVKEILNKLKYQFFKLLPEKLLNILNFYYLHLRQRQFRVLNIKDPKTFNEKIIFAKINNKQWDYSKYADKALVKKYVSDRIGNEYVIPNLGIWDSPSQIDFRDLPASFVLKANHGSGWNVVVKDKSNISEDEIRKSLKKWLGQNYYEFGREAQYQNIEKKIIAEALLQDAEGRLPSDYKVHCFRGIPRFVQVDIDRFHNHKRNIYDTEWKLQKFRWLYPNYSGNIPKPKKLDLMLEIAHELSKEFEFARIDLYQLGEEIYFGEITFHPEGGFGPIVPKKFDTMLGSFIGC